MHLFFSRYIFDSSILLQDDDFVHCIKSLRHTVGNRIHIIDGEGHLYECEIEEISKKSCSCRIISVTDNFGVHPYFLRMCVALTKNIDRFEFFVEKAVEMGVNEIIPLMCDNSERTRHNAERILRIVISAMKQSYKSYMPIVSAPQAVDAIIQEKYEGTQLIAHCYNSEQKTPILHAIQKNTPTTILIGPEGDFSQREVELALCHNWQEISLGSSRLRTETAAIISVSAVYSVHS